MDNIDYRALLKKYMDGVGEAEGVYFIGFGSMTADEKRILNEIADEISAEIEERNANRPGLSK
jgi:hypothetical protein